MNESTTPDTVSPSRRQIAIEADAYVIHGGRVFRITEPLDFASAVAVDVETGRTKVLAVSEMKPLGEDEVPNCSTDLSELSDRDWAEAQRRFRAIKPLVDCFQAGRAEAEVAAKKAGVHVATVYRWLKIYKATGEVLSLISRKRGWQEGKGRIEAEAERVVEDVLHDFYLTPQRPTGEQTVREVHRRCLERNIAAPGCTAVRHRIKRIPERDRLRGRGYAERAKNKFLPAAGRFPGADYPLSVVQIDHTPVDLVLVDDTHRRPIGRPWLTVACDVFSRMVVGYYLSFDAPSESSVAMCMAHAILPKDEWLLVHNVEAEWPVWGVPEKVHVDNGPDFRSDTFRRSCLAYGIDLEYRPVKQPRFGGHIERLLGTLLKEIHGLPGTTFSSIRDKEGYDPEKHAAMTKSEFEEWFVSMVCTVYHRRIHKGIGTSPLKKWEIGIFGNAEIGAKGIPKRPADRMSVLLDFLPAFHRTVQTTGVTIDGMHYYAEALRPWINADDPKAPGSKRHFVFRRDPRDVSAIWFKDPVLGEYFKIPFADQSLPAMSIWELREAKKSLRDSGGAAVNDAQILRAVTELRSKVEDARKRTKKARRKAQRRIEHEKKVSPATPAAERDVAPLAEFSTGAGGFVEDPVTGFGDIA